MPKDGKSNGKHPLLYQGHVYAGQLFVRVLEDVVRPLVIKSQRGKPGRVVPQSHQLKSRGFPPEVRNKIAAGQLLVPEAAIRQLLTDYWSAYPKRVRDGASDYRQLKAIVEGTWHDDPKLSGDTVLVGEISKPTQAPLHSLFTIGDPDLGRWFVQTVGSYRSIGRRVAQQHKLGSLKLKKIETGELPLPREVFLDVMQLLAAHFQRYPNDVVPRSFTKLHRFAVEQNLMKGADHG